MSAHMYEIKLIVAQALQRVCEWPAADWQKDVYRRKAANGHGEIRSRELSACSHNYMTGKNMLWDEAWTQEEWDQHLKDQDHWERTLNVIY